MNIKLIIPTKKKKRTLVNFEITESKKKALKAKCKELGMSYTYLFNNFVDQFLESK